MTSAGWCRPQNDGPGLRAITLMIYANTLIANGQMDYVKKFLWTGSSSYNGGAIKVRTLLFIAILIVLFFYYNLLV